MTTEAAIASGMQHTTNPIENKSNCNSPVINDKNHPSNITSSNLHSTRRLEQPLTESQIATYKQDGILVVDNVLTPTQLKAAQEGLRKTLLQYGIDTHNLPSTAHNICKLSSTNGSGGVLDIFYPKWKMDIATNERLFFCTTQLWESAYCHHGETQEDFKGGDDDEQYYMYHPYGRFDCKKGYAYIDRIGFRLPTVLAESIGDEIHRTSTSRSTERNGNSSEPNKRERKVKKKTKAIQRSLTPHLDCCPETFYDTRKKRKWRPIQCFVSLTDNLEPNTGGFEAVPGFHRSFHKWAQSRPLTKVTRKTSQPQNNKVGKQQKQQNHFTTVEVAPSCTGEYTHIRPKEDRDVIERIQHIPVKAGSAVFWDNRIPHANAYRNDDIHLTPRAVVYCSFLPDVALNQIYVQRQLIDLEQRSIPPGLGSASDVLNDDRWIAFDDPNIAKGVEESYDNEECIFSELGKKIMGIDKW